MKINPELKKILKEKTTWVGLATIIVASLGLESFSAEQLAAVIAGGLAVIYREKPKS